MEGMVANKLVEFVRLYGVGDDCKLEAEIWMERLVIKLLEVTHGQWIFRNLMVHDSILGVLVTKDKEELQLAIEKQKELGGDGLAEHKFGRLGKKHGRIAILLASRSSGSERNIQFTPPAETTNERRRQHGSRGRRDILSTLFYVTHRH